MHIKNERQHSIRLSNQGNVPSRYLLTVDSTEPGLIINVNVNNMPQAEIRSKEIEIKPGNKLEGNPIDLDSNTMVQSTLKSAKLAGGLSQGMVAFLGFLGRVLPGGAGKIFYDKSGEIRRLQARVGQVDYIKKKAQQNLKVVQKNKNINGKDKTEFVKADVSKADTVTAVEVQTEPIGPGESIDMILSLIFSDRENPSGSFPYRIISQQIPLVSLDRIPDPVSYPGSVVFQHINPRAKRLPSLLRILVLLTALFVFATLLFLIWF